VGHDTGLQDLGADRKLLSVPVEIRFEDVKFDVL
jgi:hypothetical protein